MAYQNDLACLVNQKVIIHTENCSYCVIIAQVCPCYIRAIEAGSGNVKYFNFDRISYVEDILP
ncbi:MAG: hypothetical protein K0S30_354 [Clostridia bacterium]|jgi:hypothetical protein|nr:hypothetical protein [Clostridia bacterium]